MALLRGATTSPLVEVKRAVMRGIHADAGCAKENAKNELKRFLKRLRGRSAWVSEEVVPFTCRHLGINIDLYMMGYAEDELVQQDSELNVSTICVTNNIGKKFCNDMVENGSRRSMRIEKSHASPLRFRRALSIEQEMESCNFCIGGRPSSSTGPPCDRQDADANPGDGEQVQFLNCDVADRDLMPVALRRSRYMWHQAFGQRHLAFRYMARRGAYVSSFRRAIAKELRAAIRAISSRDDTGPELLDELIVHVDWSQVGPAAAAAAVEQQASNSMQIAGSTVSPTEPFVLKS